MMDFRTAVLSLVASVLIVGSSVASERSFVLATTTSTENSGLLNALIEKFSGTTNIRVDVVAVGTGQALEIGKEGDAAALLTHDREGENAFIAAGFGTDRRDVMYNDFVIIGPASDPAQLSDAPTATQAFDRIAKSGAAFVSRGDDSGTHRKERRLWMNAGLNIDDFGPFYREAGAGMGQVLLTTIEMDGYTLSDRGTWISFERKSDHTIVFEGDPPLFNPYSSILVTHDALSDEERQSAAQWHSWLTSPAGQAAIDAFTVNGQQLFLSGGLDEDT